MLRWASRICAVPAGLLALAAFVAYFAPTVPLTGSVAHVRESHSRRGASYEVVVRTPSDEVTAEVGSMLAQATYDGDSAVVQATPFFEFAHSVAVYRDGALVGSSARGALFAWSLPLFVLAIAAYTLSWWHSTDPLRIVMAAAFFNVGVTVVAAAAAYRSINP